MPYQYKPKEQGHPASEAEKKKKRSASSSCSRKCRVREEKRDEGKESHSYFHKRRGREIAEVFANEGKREGKRPLLWTYDKVINSKKGRGKEDMHRLHPPKRKRKLLSNTEEKDMYSKARGRKKSFNLEGGKEGPTLIRFGGGKKE